jgi:hypothetical protein
VSASVSAGGGLLDGFDNVMVGQTADDVERSQPSAQKRSRFDRFAGSSDGSPSGPGAMIGSTPSSVHARVLDPRSVALARRILGLPAEGPVTTP